MSPATTPARHVVATAAGIDPHTARIAALIDPEFVTEAGWDPAGFMLVPPPGHRLLGCPVCQGRGLLDHRTGSRPDLRLMLASAGRTRAQRRGDHLAARPGAADTRPG
jgi:hypothetical protein